MPTMLIVLVDHLCAKGKRVKSTSNCYHSHVITPITHEIPHICKLSSPSCLCLLIVHHLSHASTFPFSTISLTPLPDYVPRSPSCLSISFHQNSNWLFSLALTIFLSLYLAQTVSDKRYIT